MSSLQWSMGNPDELRVNETDDENNRSEKLSRIAEIEAGHISLKKYDEEHMPKRRSCSRIGYLIITFVLFVLSATLTALFLHFVCGFTWETYSKSAMIYIWTILAVCVIGFILLILTFLIAHILGPIHDRAYNKRVEKYFIEHKAARVEAYQRGVDEKRLERELVELMRADEAAEKPKDTEKTDK